MPSQTGTDGGGLVTPPSKSERVAGEILSYLFNEWEPKTTGAIQAILARHYPEPEQPQPPAPDLGFDRERLLRSLACLPLVVDEEVHDDLIPQVRSLLAAHDALEQERDRLLEALRRYGRHDRRVGKRPGCSINPGGPIMEALGDGEKRPCNCGLDAALAETGGEGEK